MSTCIATSLATVLFTAGVALAGADGAAPRAVVQQVTDDAVRILKDKALAPDQKRHRLEEVVYASVDFDTLSRLVLARNWTRLSPPQQEEFVREFREHLSMTYGRRIDSYRNEEVRITGDRAEARGDWTVQTRILRGGGSDDVLVDYRLRKAGEDWKIIDFIIEGVSLVANFRSQFQDFFSGSGGAERLITLLREKNQKGEPLGAS